MICIHILYLNTGFTDIFLQIGKQHIEVIKYKYFGMKINIHYIKLLKLYVISKE